MTPLRREPAAAHDAGYPTFAEFDPSRRAALRSIAAAALGALGLQLVGCPGGGGSGPGGGPATDGPVGGGPATDGPVGGGPATDGPGPVGPPEEWVPWKDHPPLAGAVPAPRPVEPVAIVVGGGPIDVTFSDGRTARLAVALVVQPGLTPGGVKAGAPEHVAAVKAAAASLPGAVLDDAAGLSRLEARIAEEVTKATPGLAIEGVQAAPALPEPPAPEPPAGAAREAQERAAPREAARGEAAAPAAPAVRARVWVPCGRPGCTSCAAR